MTSGSLKVCGSDTSCALDRQGHGTHCAGTAGGSRFGVASTAAVHAVKTLSDRGSGARSWQMAAIDWVTANGERPAVISMSLGGSGADPSYTRAIGAATDNGVTVVVAGGNSNADACNFSPAFAERAITVGSTTSRDARSSFSNYGSCTNIWAPGSSVVSASSSSDTGSRSLSGTSMACPHVSGAAALILSGNPSMKSSAVLQELLANAERNVLSGLRSGDTNALLSVAGTRSADVNIAQELSLTVSDCGGNGHVARLVDWTPKKVNIGETTTISASGVVSARVAGGTVNAKIQMTGFPWLVLGEIKNANICNSFTLTLSSAGVTGGTLEWSGIACPLAAGPTTIGLKLKLNTGLPGHFLGTQGSITAKTSDGKDLLCANTRTR